MMQKKLNKQLTVYLSKSLLIEYKELELVRVILTGLGFKVTEYQPGTEYSDKLINNADFVVFYTKEKPIAIYSGGYNTFVGKGQYEEAFRCSRSAKPAFLLHQLKSNDLLISKLTGDPYRAPDHKIYDISDWKVKYGTIGSYVMGMSVVPLFHFLQGLFGLRDLNEYPLTPEEAYNIKLPYSGQIYNNRLLLLLK